MPYLSSLATVCTSCRSAVTCAHLSPMADRKELIVLAKLARELGRPGDMRNYMSQLVALVHEQQQELDWDERNQLSVAFKTHTEQQRTALSKLAARARKQKEAEQLAATDKYKQMVSPPFQRVQQTVA